MALTGVYLLRQTREEEMDKIRKLLEDLMKAAGGAGQGKAGDTRETTLKTEAEAISAAVTAAGADREKVLAVLKENEPVIQAMLKAIDAGGADMDENAPVQVPVAKSAGGSDAVATLRKAQVVLESVTKADPPDPKVIKCARCKWEGAADQLKKGACPQCGKELVAKSDDTPSDGFDAVKANLLKRVDAVGAMGPDDATTETAELTGILSDLRKTDHGGKDAELEKALEDLDKIAKGEDPDDTVWDCRDMNEAADDEDD